MVGRWYEDFPILAKEVYGHDLVYLDSAATSQMPVQVVERLAAYYAGEHANVHRGVHFLSERATCMVEDARQNVASFIGAKDADEVVFTSGCTDSLNLVAFGLAHRFRPGDAVVVSELEHHSNFVPWQRMCEQRGLEFCVWHANDAELELAALEEILRDHSVKVVAVTQVSNLTGTAPAIGEITRMAHDAGATVVVDGAQGILHEDTDVDAQGIDFYAFSAHKMCGPTGVGVLFGRRELLEGLMPQRFGGGMVDRVTEASTTLGALPLRLEAGTPNVAGIIGLDAAIRYLLDNDLSAMRAYERELLDYLTERLRSTDGVEVLGNPGRRVGLVSFNLCGMHAYDVAFMLDKLGIAVRSGTHCAQPGLEGLGQEAAVRASLAFYNSKVDIDRLCEGLERLRTLVG